MHGCDVDKAREICNFYIFGIRSFKYHKLCLEFARKAANRLDFYNLLRTINSAAKCTLLLLALQQADFIALVSFHKSDWRRFNLLHVSLPVKPFFIPVKHVFI